MYKGLTYSNTYAFLAENDGERALFIGQKINKLGGERSSYAEKMKILPI